MRLAQAGDPVYSWMEFLPGLSGPSRGLPSPHCPLHSARMSAEQCLAHPWLNNLAEKAKRCNRRLKSQILLKKYLMKRRWKVHDLGQKEGGWEVGEPQCQLQPYQRCLGSLY